MLLFKDYRILWAAAAAALLLSASPACTLITDTQPKPVDAAADPGQDPDDGDEEEEAPQVIECDTIAWTCPMDATCECDLAGGRIVCLGDCDVRIVGAGSMINCASGADCTGDCSAASCTMNCGTGGTCSLECSAPDCTLICATGATCTIDCNVLPSECHCLNC